MNLAKKIAEGLTEEQLSLILEHICNYKFYIHGNRQMAVISRHLNTVFKTIKYFQVQIKTSAGEPILSGMGSYDYPYEILGKESYDFLYPSFAAGTGEFLYNLSEHHLKIFLNKVYKHNEKVFDMYV